jgi:hypothetical protein
MSVVFVGALNTPNFICLSSDIVANALSGAVRPGNTIFAYDTAEWWIIEPDLTLSQYALPVQITIDPGTVTIGEVSIDQPVASATHIAPYYGTQSVATPGTAEPLVASATYVLSLTVWPKLSNTDDVYFGTSIVDKDTSQQIILSPGGSSAIIDAPLGYKVDVHNWYVDAKVGTEGVNYMYMK